LDNSAKAAADYEEIKEIRSEPSPVMPEGVQRIMEEVKEEIKSQVESLREELKEAAAANDIK
jgi:hypothetical protein